MDFAENYTCTTQHEIQQAHWKQQQVSLFTASVNSKDFQSSYLVVSDETNHSRYAVWNFNKAIMEDVKKKWPEIKETRDFTDRCAQQFKNMFTISLLAYTEEDFGVKTQHSFMATSQGKGPHDGIGGTFKRRVRDTVMSANVNVIDAKSFYNVAKEIAEQTVVLFVSKKDIDNTKALLDLRWKNLAPMRGIRTCHHFEALNNNRIRAAVSSKNDSMRIYNIYKK
jgi:hypothetical protein